MGEAWNYRLRLYHEKALNYYYAKRYGKDFKKTIYRNESAKKRVRAINNMILPLSYKPTKDGLYLETNNSFIQCLIVGPLSPRFKGRQIFPTGFDATLIPELLNIGTNQETSIEICQIVYPLNPEEVNEHLESARRALAVASKIQEAKDKVLRQHDKTNDFAAEGIEEYQRKIFDGKIKLFHFALVLAIQGVTKKEVKRTMGKITTMLDRRVILHELPEKGMDEAYKSMMPTPYVWQKVFKRSVPTETCAKTSLMYNPNPLLADYGRYMGMNERTGNPIFFNFEDEENVCGHGLIIGKSGIGKSTDLLKDDERAYLDGDDVVHIVPKKDNKTKHERVCKALEGFFLKYGDPDATPNMFAVFFDETRMNDTIDGRQAAYNSHFNTLIDSIGLLVGSGYTDQQKNWLCEGLSKLYQDFHVIDGQGKVKPENFTKWKDPRFWPFFPDLRNIWYAWLNDGKHKNPMVSGPIEALYNNTTMIQPWMPLGFLCTKKLLDLSNRYIVADLSALSDTPNVQQAITLQLMSIINTKLENANEDQVNRRCLVTLDEGADLLKNKLMRLQVESLFRKGRSAGAYIKIVSQDLAAFDREMLDMIKANTDYVLLFGGYRGDNIDPLIKEFNLTDDDIVRLLEPGKGRGILILGSNHIPYLNVLNSFEKNLLYGNCPLSELNKEYIEEQEVEASLLIHPAYEWIARECGILCKDWLKNKNEYPNGYEKEKETNPITGKRTVVFYKRSLVKEDGHIKNQTRSHYFTVCMLAGELMRLGAEISLDDYGTNQKADIVAVFTLADGTKYTIAFEYETPEKKASIEDLREKRRMLENMKEGEASCFDDVMFVGMHDYIPHLIEALGNDYVLQRGDQVAQYVEIIKTKKPSVSPLPSGEQTAEAA